MAYTRTKKNQRKGISLMELTNLFPNDAAADKWLKNDALAEANRDEDFVRLRLAWYF